MSTLSIFTLLRDQARDLVVPGDRIIEIDGHPMSQRLVVHETPWEMEGALRLVNPLGTETIWNLYPGTQVRHDITIERETVLYPPGDYSAEAPTREEFEATLPAPGPSWDKRERAALRRNPHYADTLSLLDPTGKATDLRAVRFKPDFRGRDASMHSHTCGTLGAFYGWTEKVGTFTWRLTERGQQVLAAYRTERGQT